jgi:hypothetical protein
MGQETKDETVETRCTFKSTIAGIENWGSVFFQPFGSDVAGSLTCDMSEWISLWDQGLSGTSNCEPAAWTGKPSLITRQMIVLYLFVPCLIVHMSLILRSVHVPDAVFAHLSREV